MAFRAVAFAWFLGAAEAHDAAEDSRGPPCRKSPLLAALNLTSHHQMLIAYSGKGWEWTKRRHGKGGKGGKLRKKVTMLSDMWRFHLETKTWFPIDYGEEGPEGRWKEGATPVYNNSQLVLMGGCTKTSVKFSRDDLWVFSPEKGRWRRVPTENTPVRRRGHVLVANHTHLIMFGGKSTKQDAQESYDELEDEGLGEKVQPGEKCLIDLWAIPKEPVLADTSEVARWTEGAPFPATCRWGATGSYVRDHDGKKYLAFFGGRHLGAFQAEHTDRSAYVYYNDLWLYDFVKDRWGEAPTIGRRPPARDHHGAATLEDQIFIYGGRCSEKREKTSVLADVWSYSLTTLRWTLHEPVGSAPAARFMPGVSDVIYKGRPHLAIFAGETLPGSTKRTTLNDVWVFDPKEAEWSELFASTCSEEPGLEAGELAGPNVQALLCLATGFGFVFTLFMLMRTFGRRAQAKEMQAPLLE
ncbi:unnamed protein product [Durusdinium trenchii]|uniref:Uncharacterized protein n=2 Tax=Durusdinium trenchii TaxID=1381693 RepID=A0ABP0L8I8_9DINO